MMDKDARFALFFGFMMFGEPRLRAALKQHGITDGSGHIVVWHPTLYQHDDPKDALKTGINSGWLYEKFATARAADHCRWKLQQQDAFLFWVRPPPPPDPPEQMMLSGDWPLITASDLSL